MPATLNFTENDLFVALRGFLLTILPTTVDIIRAQVNRVPEPANPDFVILNSVGRERLGSNIDTYSDGFPSGPSVLNAMQKIRVTFQVDVHGPSSADNVQIISTFFRDYVATDYFSSLTGADAQVLYASDPKQLPFINAEQQFEDRWSIDLNIQANQVATLPQDFFDQAEAGLINVDVVYPP